MFDWVKLIFVRCHYINPRTMDLSVQFTFRNKNYTCNIYIDSSADPCLIFVILFDKEIISEFGDEVTIKTDCEKLLPKKDDYPKLIELRQAIFDSVKKI